MLRSKFICAILLMAAAHSGYAQKNTNSYAITGTSSNHFLWSDIKQIDIETGKVVKVIFEAAKSPVKIMDKDNVVGVNEHMLNTMSVGLAACALDAVHNRLYFSPMLYSDISYIDLNRVSANFITIKKNIIASVVKEGFQPEQNQITRMVIAADGFGYALTNNANHLIRFSTDNNPLVEDLGPVTEQPNHNNITLQNKFTGWGGDMVGDAFGNLIVVSAGHNVFKINVATKAVSVIGVISGLPANYTTNGAVVDGEGNLVISTANALDALYKVDIKDFTARKVVSTEKPFNASDLANGNFLYQREADKIALSKSLQSATTNSGKIFPNPVPVGAEFNVALHVPTTGNYKVIITDLAAKELQFNLVSFAGYSTKVKLAKPQASGVYLVNVINDKNELVLKEKVFFN